MKFESMNKHIAVFLVLSLLLNTPVYAQSDDNSSTESEVNSAPSETNSGSNFESETVALRPSDAIGFNLLNIPPPPTEGGALQESPVSLDILKTLQDFGGKSDVGLFSGSMNYSYPIPISPGRNGMTPQLSLNYSSNERQFNSLVGFGWSLPSSSIYRSTTRGTDQLYTIDSFAASINGSASELVLIDDINGTYGNTVESNFTEYDFNGTSWTATDTKGMVYTFGSAAATRQADPNDSSRVYKWMLERVEDTNGNYITYTYTQDQGQIYPATIRYTGHNATDDGLYEVRFVLGNRSGGYTEYNRGFKVSTAKRIEAIELWRTDTNVKIYIFDLEYSARNKAVEHLVSVTQKTDTESLPATSFEYFDGTETETNKRIDLLKQINYPYGGIETFTYQPSTAYKIGTALANKVPFVVHTLKSQTVKESGTAPGYTTSYRYEDGHYFFDPADSYKKEYAGFGKVRVTDPANNYTIHSFHQSQFSDDYASEGEFNDHISKKGRTYRVDHFDAMGNKFQTQWNQWKHDALANQDVTKDRHFVYLAQNVSADYDGNTDYRAKANSFTYDVYGNQIRIDDFGEVILNNDAGDFTDDLVDEAKYQEIDYTLNTTLRILALPARERWRLGTNNKVISQVIRLYDGQGFNNRHLVTKGNLTHERVYSQFNPTIYNQTRRVYNQFGLVTQVFDPLNKKTIIGYNSKKLQPTKITNPLGHITKQNYYYRFNKPKTNTNANNAKTINTYDDFGRLTKVQKSRLNDITKNYNEKLISYNLSSYPVYTETKTFTQNNGVQILSRDYLDGLGREIQNRTEAEGTNFVVSSKTYDERGNVAKTFLPVFGNGSAFTAIDPNGIGNSMTYDALGRQNAITNLLGTTTVAFDQWQTVTTDPLGNKKTAHHDARGNLAKLTEHLNSTAYDTVYTYSANNDLEKITDALGNQKLYTYDLASRKLTETDFHRSNDTTFGTKSWTYDKSSNVTSSTDNNGQVINYSYDALNRVLTEDDPTQTGTEVTYSYDTATNGVGLVASVTSPGATKSFQYDVWGRPSQTSYPVDGQTFNLAMNYDLLGNPINLTYPNSAAVNYTYNAAGQLNAIQLGTDNVITNLDYSPLGLVSQIDYANGVTTQNTYDINDLYRLSRKLTESGTVKLQDLNYTYDAANNVTQIVDNSDTNTAKTTVYGYDDLYRLTSVAVTGSANNADYSRTYSYDIIGNLLNRSDVGNYVYAGNSNATGSSTNASPHAVTSVNGTVYTYDDVGNLTSNGTWTHSYDYQNRLTNSTDGSTTMNYTYDEGRDRVMKENTSTNKKTYYIDKYYDLEGTTAKAHIYAGNTKLATHKTTTQ